MIHPETVRVLGLKSWTRAACYDLYVAINTEFDTPASLEEALTWWQDKPEKMNRVWWVLNYYAETLDPSRRLRARIERTLDRMAEEAVRAGEVSEEETPPADPPPEPPAE